MVSQSYDDYHPVIAPVLAKLGACCQRTNNHVEAAVHLQHGIACVTSPTCTAPCKCACTFCACGVGAGRGGGCTQIECVRALKGLALPHTSHSGDIALAGSRRLHFMLATALVM